MFADFKKVKNHWAKNWLWVFFTVLKRNYQFFHPCLLGLFLISLRLFYFSIFFLISSLPLIKLGTLVPPLLFTVSLFYIITPLSFVYYNTIPNTWVIVLFLIFNSFCLFQIDYKVHTRSQCVSTFTQRSFYRLAASRRIIDRSWKKPLQLRGFGERRSPSRLGGIYSGVVGPLEVIMPRYNRATVRWPRW